MPHVSKRKLNKGTMLDLERYIISIIQDTGTKTRTRIFDELLTRTEKMMLAKRLGTLFLLRKGASPYKISKTLGISPSTAERFEYARLSNKYKHTTDWIWKNSDDGAFEKFMESLVALAFTGRTRSFKKSVDEW